MQTQVTQPRCLLLTPSLRPPLSPWTWMENQLGHFAHQSLWPQPSMAPTSWLTAPEMTRGLVFTGQRPSRQAPGGPVYSQVCSLLQNWAGNKAAPPPREKSSPMQAKSNSTWLNTNFCGFLHISKKKNIFLSLPTQALFATEEMWIGTVFLLPSWTVVCTNKWSERATQRMGQGTLECLDGAQPLLFLTKRKEMCTQRHPLQFYL